MDRIFSDPAITAIVFALCIPIVGIIAHFWHETVVVRSNNELKRDMLERGMSAQEIERVINAGASGDRDEDS